MDTAYKVDIQIACKESLVLPQKQLCDWVHLALKEHKPKAELTLRLVEPKEIKILNQRFRKKSKPTNVLAFPTQIPETLELDYPFLGDLILCPAVVSAEAENYALRFEDHFAHILIHGVLHLLGYDHIHKEDEAIMQAMEIKLLATCGISNPYV